MLPFPLLFLPSPLMFAFPLSLSLSLEISGSPSTSLERSLFLSDSEIVAMMKAMSAPQRASLLASLTSTTREAFLSATHSTSATRASSSTSVHAQPQLCAQHQTSHNEPLSGSTRGPAGAHVAQDALASWTISKQERAAAQSAATQQLLDSRVVDDVGCTGVQEGGGAGPGWAVGTTRDCSENGGRLEETEEEKEDARRLDVLNNVFHQLKFERESKVKEESSRLEAIRQLRAESNEMDALSMIALSCTLQTRIRTRTSTMAYGAARTCIRMASAHAHTHAHALTRTITHARRMHIHSLAHITTDALFSIFFT